LGFYSHGLFRGTRFILISFTSGSGLPSSVRSFDCPVIASDRCECYAPSWVAKPAWESSAKTLELEAHRHVRAAESKKKIKNRFFICIDLVVFGCPCYSLRWIA